MVKNLEKKEIVYLSGIHVTDFDIDYLGSQLIILPNILNPLKSIRLGISNINYIAEIFKTFSETSRPLINQV